MFEMRLEDILMILLIVLLWAIPVVLFSWLVARFMGQRRKLRELEDRLSRLEDRDSE